MRVMRETEASLAFVALRLRSGWGYRFVQFLESDGDLLEKV